MNSLLVYLFILDLRFIIEKFKKPLNKVSSMILKYPIKSPISIGLVGLGKMGVAIVHQIKLSRYFELKAVAEIRLNAAIEILRNAGYEPKIVNDSDDIVKIEKPNSVAVTTNFELLPYAENIDVLIDSTGVIEVGAKLGYLAAINRKNIVMMNAEADALLGPILNHFAMLSGTIYTGDIGDEPGAIMHYLYKPFHRIGMNIIVAGKGKNNPLVRHANPDTLKNDAVKKKLNPRVLTSFVDGTKTMIEMAILSNATGLLPDIRGMHGPIVSNVKELVKIFKRKEDGGVLEKEGVVEYVIGIAPGVFIAVDTEDEEVSENLKYLSVGEEKPYVFYRPYHLPGTETILSAYHVAAYKEPIIAPTGVYSEVIAYAKKEMSRGDMIDGIGGFTVYGLIEESKKVKEEGLLPIGLSEGCKLKRGIEKDQPIAMDDVEIPDSFTYQLWGLQEKVFPVK